MRVFLACRAGNEGDGEVPSPNIRRVAVVLASSLKPVITTRRAVVDRKDNWYVIVLIISTLYQFPAEPHISASKHGHRKTGKEKNPKNREISGENLINGMKHTR